MVLCAELHIDLPDYFGPVASHCNFLQLPTLTALKHLFAMSKILHVSFTSPTFDFERDITIDELIEVITEHVSIYEEAATAISLVGSIYDSGSYEGTAWRIWFVKRDPMPTLH